MSTNGQVLPKIIEKALYDKKTFTDALFQRPDSLAKLLPYEEYLENLGLFVNKDGSLGVVFKAIPIEHEPLVGNRITEIVNSLKTWFSLPENCVLQVLYDQSPITKRDSRWMEFQEKFKYPHPVSSTLMDERIKMFRESFNERTPKRPIKREIYVSIRFFPSEKNRNEIKNLLRTDDKFLFEEMKEFAKESKNFKYIIEQFKSYSKVDLIQLNGQELADILRRFFNPKEYYLREFAPLNNHTPIADQLIYNAPTLDYKGIERQRVHTRTLSLKTSPLVAYPGGMAYFTKLNFPFKLSLNFSFPTQRKSKTFFDMKEFFLQNTPSEKAKMQKEEITEVQHKLARGDKCLFMTFNVVLEGENEEVLDERTRELVSIFHNELSTEVIVEDDVGLGLCLNTLPLNYTPDADYSSQRYIRILQSDATKFLPIFGSFKGMKNPISLHISRENELVPFNLTENETSNHTVVLADSGSGKSAFILDCIQSAKRLDPEPLVFVIDKKSSYKMMANYFDSDMTVFEPGVELPFSPFRGTYDESKIEFLTNLLITAMKLTSEDFSLQSEHISAITKSLKNAYRKKVQEHGLIYNDGELADSETDEVFEVTMGDVISALGSLASDSDFESMQDHIEEVINKLKPFYGDGHYARYFNSTQKNKKSKRDCLFYIYDLDALDKDPTLQVLMTMSVIDEIRSIIRKPEHEGRSGFIVIEELGMLGRDNPTAKKFIVDAAETFRKLGFWLIGLTPRPQNYFEMEAGQAMWGVADNFVFLRMSPDNVDYLCKKSSLFDEATEQIIKSLSTKRGEYAEVFYSNKDKSRQGAFRYIQTPLDVWLSPTNQEDFTLAMSVIKKHKGNTWKALEELAKEYPTGAKSKQKESE